MSNWFVVELTSENVPTSWFTVELTSEHVEPLEPVEPPAAVKVGGSQGERIYGGGPWMWPWEQTFPGSVSLVKEVGGVVATGELVRHPQFEATFSGSHALSREFEIRFSGQRGEASHWNRLLEDDEELLLSL